jgi:hypothetical protein
MRIFYKKIPFPLGFSSKLGGIILFANHSKYSTQWRKERRGNICLKR